MVSCWRQTCDRGAANACLLQLLGSQGRLLLLLGSLVKHLHLSPELSLNMDPRLHLHLGLIRLGSSFQIQLW